MARYEYMQLRLADMPEDVIAHYKLNEIATLDGYILQDTEGNVRLTTGWDHCPATTYYWKNAYKKMVTAKLWQHDTCPISFSLIIEDFGLNMWARRTRNMC